MPVFAAGNPANYGPGGPTAYYIFQNNQYQYIANPPADSRDWYNGDPGGYDTVQAPGTAKNVLTVGSILDITSSTVSLSGFSGRGPTDDGRIKPDVVAVGQRNSSLGQGSSLFLARIGSNSAYYDGVTADSEGFLYAVGTSFASPQAMAGLALAQQRRTQLFPAAGPLLASTWRVLAIHTALGLGAPGPDFFFGWGVFNALGIVQVLESDAALGRGSLVKEFAVEQGQPRSFFVHLPANTSATFTLGWTDPEGSPPPVDSVVDPLTPMLVNNLDLTVQDTLAGTTHYPWVLNPALDTENQAARQAAATTGVDTLNNIERIDLTTTAQARTFRVTVTPQGTITGGPQKVSLVITGAVPAPPAHVNFTASGNPSNANEMAYTVKTDPGAFFTLQTSTELTSGTWSDVSAGTVFATGEQTTLLVNKNANEARRFWRLRRGE